MNTFSKGRKRRHLSEIEQEAICRASLFGATKDSYGQDYYEHLFEQYGIFAGSVERNSELKLKINSYFLTINTVLVTGIGLILSKPGVLGPTVWHLLLPLAGILISIIWWGVTYSYKQRSVAKLRILQCIEAILPLALYTTEWQLMDEDHNQFVFKKFLFRIDLFIPWVFIFCYLLFIIVV